MAGGSARAWRLHEMKHAVEASLEQTCTEYARGVITDLVKAERPPRRRTNARNAFCYPQRGMLEALGTILWLVDHNDKTLVRCRATKWLVMTSNCSSDAVNSCTPLAFRA